MRVVLTRREGIDAPDGVSIFIVALAQALIELNHQVEIVVGSPHCRAAYERLLSPRLDLPIVACRKRRSGSFMAWFRAKALIDRFQPDLVIHSETLPKPLSGTVVQAVHDLEPRRSWHASLRRRVRRASMRRCDHVVATTAELRQELVRDLGMPASRIALIPKCVDRTLYHSRVVAQREHAILHAGTSPYKDPVASIKAFGALDDATAWLYVTGDVTDAVRQAVKALPGHLQNRVGLMGDLDGKAVRDLHSRVRLASFPTHYAVPVGSATVMEAIASGTPIVGSRSLSRDVLCENVNGLVVDIEAEIMARAFRAVLNDNPLWSRLSNGAGQMAERFDAHRVAHQYPWAGETEGGQGAWHVFPALGEAPRPARPHRTAWVLREEVEHDLRLLSRRPAGTCIPAGNAEMGACCDRGADLFLRKGRPERADARTGTRDRGRGQGRHHCCHATISCGAFHARRAGTDRTAGPQGGGLPHFGHAGRYGHDYGADDFGFGAPMVAGNIAGAFGVAGHQRRVDASRTGWRSLGRRTG